MKILKTPIKGLFIVKQGNYKDGRGSLREIYNRKIIGNKIFKYDSKNQKNFQKTVKKSKNIKISSFAIKEFRNNFFLGKKFDYPVSVLDLLFLKGPESGYFINNY